MNAFHPDYVKTYMPEFLSTIRSESAAKVNGQKSGAIARQRVSLANTDFHVFSRAGAPKVKK